MSSDGAQPDKFANLLEHRHPNCLKFDKQGRLYIGDAVGSVHIWDVQVIGFITFINYIVEVPESFCL